MLLKILARPGKSQPGYIGMWQTADKTTARKPQGGSAHNNRFDIATSRQAICIILRSLPIGEWP